MSKKKLTVTFLNISHHFIAEGIVNILEKLFSMPVIEMTIDIKSEDAWTNFESQMNTINAEMHIVIASNETALLATLWASRGRCHSILLDPVMERSQWTAALPEFDIQDAPEGSISYHLFSNIDDEVESNARKYFDGICSADFIHGYSHNRIVLFKHLYDTLKESPLLGIAIKIDNSIKIFDDEDWKYLADFDPDDFVSTANLLKDYNENQYGYDTLLEACQTQWLEIIKYVVDNQEPFLNQREFEELVLSLTENGMYDPEAEGEEEFVQECEKELRKGVIK